MKTLKESGRSWGGRAGVEPASGHVSRNEMRLSQTLLNLLSRHRFHSVTTLVSISYSHIRSLLTLSFYPLVVFIPTASYQKETSIRTRDIFRIGHGVWRRSVCRWKVQIYLMESRPGKIPSSHSFSYLISFLDASSIREAIWPLFYNLLSPINVLVSTLLSSNYVPARSKYFGSVETTKE